MILLLTDLHWGIKKFSDKYYKLQMDYFKEVIFPYILENKISTVIHAGDLIDNEMEIDNKLLLDLQSDFIEWFEQNKIRLILLCGNHDSYHKNATEYNFNKIVSSGKKYIIDISKTDLRRINSNSNYGFVPHSKKFSELEDLGVPDVIFAHHDVADVTFNIHQKSKKGLDLDVLEKLKVPILLGHYHNKSVTRNCRYLGTLYQHNWGEFGFRKGFHVLDDTIKITVDNIENHLYFIEQTTLPKHIKIEYIQEGRKQPVFIVNDGIEDEKIISDYNTIRDIVSKNYVEIKAENYNVETKYLEMINELNSICYSEIIINNSKRLNKAIEQLLEMDQEQSDDVSNDSGIIDLCKHFFTLLPSSLENKNEIEELFLEKIELI